MAGRRPGPKDGQLTVRDLLNKFLAFKQLAVDSGEMRPASFRTYLARVCPQIAQVFGLTTPVASLTAQDFERLRGEFAAKALATQCLEIRLVRAVFNYASDSGLIPQPLRYRRGPDSDVKRLERAFG